MNDRLMDDIAGRAEEVAELTADLIRFPTINPPGEAYAPCAEFVGDRMKRRGFAVEDIRGEGSPGDTDR